jgi:Vacuolar protein sorting-associated protein 62
VITPIFKLDSQEKWRPQPAETAEALATINGRPVKLAALPSTGRMDFPSTMTDPTNTPLVGYHRVVEAVNLWWHQFWLWYLYNPWNVAGFGQHEGDWEFVQLASVDAEGERPVLMTASQHRGGERREFWRCELAGKRPVVYVALGSHANYFTPGERGEDVADGRGRTLSRIKWREFDDDWATWPGMWGNSTGAGPSPTSPGNQGDRWRAPHLYHSAAR